MRFGSVCSGIEAASVAWNPLGWEAAWFSEIEPFPCAVLSHRFPSVPNLGDMTTLPERIISGEVEAPDLLCGGTPCQAFSTAGKRLSLADERGNLSLVFCRIADAIDTARARAGLRPAVIFWENVPGVLHTKDNALGCFFGLLAGSDQPAIAPGGRWPSAGVLFGGRRRVAWRVLDAQFFGVPQRRRRVFVVASADPGIDPAAVLLERTGLSGDSEKGRGEEQASADGTAGRSPCSSEGLTFACQSFFEWKKSDKASALKLSTVTAGADSALVVYDMTHADEAVRTCGAFVPTLSARMGTGGNQVPLIHETAPIRRLTPVECERLQGFPDNWTRIPYRNKPEELCPDSHRYKAIGNSWAVPVVRWIGNRINKHMEGLL